MNRVCVFGLGEAGSLFAADLVNAGQSVAGYDPAPVDTPAGVERFDNPDDAVAGADTIIALTASADAEQALGQAFEQIPPDALYADFSTGSAGLKRRLADRAAQRQLAFADIALLAIVPGNGIRTNSLASGTGAERFVAQFSPLGTPVSSLGDSAGDAATRKLVRSVFMKGLAAVTIEAMKAAETVGLSDWLWNNISAEIAQADEALLHRLVAGTELHAQRRLGEMEAAAELLRELNVEPLMTDSTVNNLKAVIADRLPYIPAPGSIERDAQRGAGN